MALPASFAARIRQITVMIAELCRSIQSLRSSRMCWERSLRTK